MELASTEVCAVDERRGDEIMWNRLRQNSYFKCDLKMSNTEITKIN